CVLVGMYFLFLFVSSLFSPSFFLRIPRPLISTLFPYTTLFRSDPAFQFAKPIDFSSSKNRWIANTILLTITFDVPSQICRSFIRSEEHTSELQSRGHLVCRLLLEKKKTHLMTCPTLPHVLRQHL